MTIKTIIIKLIILNLYLYKIYYIYYFLKKGQAQECRRVLIGLH